MKRQLQGIAIILFCILLTLAYGSEPVFDFSFQWSIIFTILGIAGFIMSLLKGKDDK